MKNNTQHGYAILFTVILVSIILTITIGLSNIAYKQLVISHVSKDSELAFYQSDTASECGLYIDRVSGFFTPSIPPTIPCGVNSTGTTIQLNTAAAINGNIETYTLTPAGSWNTSLSPCFSVIFTKTNPIDPTNPVLNNMKAHGYNLCLLSSPRAVEREEEINY